MPIVRSNFRSRGKRDFCSFKSAKGNKKQGADASQEMDCMRARENVKEAAGLVAGDVHALRDKLPPGNELPGHEQKSKDRGGKPKSTKTETVRKKEPPPRRFQSKTARQKNERVGPENARKMDRHPQIVAAPQDDEGAGERHEKHQNGNDTDRDGSRVAFGRGRRLVAAMAFFAAIVAIIASTGRWRGATASTADIFDDEFDVRRCGCARHDDVLYSPDPILRTLFCRLPHLDYLLPSLARLLANLSSKLRTSPFALLRASGGKVLRHEIFGQAGHAELIGPTIHHRASGAKIVGGRG